MIRPEIKEKTAEELFNSVNPYGLYSIVCVKGSQISVVLSWKKVDETYIYRVRSLSQFEHQDIYCFHKDLAAYR